MMVLESLDDIKVAFIAVLDAGTADSVPGPLGPWPVFACVGLGLGRTFRCFVDSSPPRS